MNVYLEKFNSSLLENMYCLQAMVEGIFS